MIQSFPMNRFLQKLALDIEYDNQVTYRRILLITGVLLITSLVLTFFALFNAFIVHNYIFTIFDSIAALVSMYAIYNLKQYKNVPLAAKISTLNLMVLFLILLFINGSDNYVLIWTVFIPIYAILTNGKNIGLYFSLIFYTVLFTLSYVSIGIWEQGDWLLEGWVRLVMTSSVLTVAMYLNEAAMEESDKQLLEIRENETRYIQQLKKTSITDELTGLYNRRHYNEMIPKLISLAKRKHHLVTFFILDIDYFKNYNDTYGHIRGDETLIEVSQVIKHHIQRGDDFVFRLGGEEFAGIIISDNKEKTHEWVFSMTQIIEDLKIEHSESKVSQYLTVSIGVATICEAKDYGIDHLYHFADEALYIAKNSGRNRSELNALCT